MSDPHRVPQAAVWVLGRSDDVEVVRFALRHGEDPESGLRSRGFVVLAPDQVVGRADPHELLLCYRVEAIGALPSGAAAAPPVDAGLVAAPGETPVPYQRVAVYAVVRSSRGILLTQLSDRTNAAGSWGLCGGGVDPGELPEEALHREVWEETGQRVELSGLESVITRHWVGRAPSGRLEDFHAVRIVYRASCPEPTEPVVLDEGGTTSSAAWVPEGEVLRHDLTPGWRDLLTSLLPESHA